MKDRVDIAFVEDLPRFARTLTRLRGCVFVAALLSTSFVASAIWSQETSFETPPPSDFSLPSTPTPMPPDRSVGSGGVASSFDLSAPRVSPSLEPTPQFVLTRSGAIMEGRVVDVGETYRVEFDGGGSINASKLDVLFVGTSREAVYAYKESETRLEDVNETLRLADWAMRRQLSHCALGTLRRRLDASVDEAERRGLQAKIDELEVAEVRRLDAARALAAHENRQKARELASTTSAPSAVVTSRSSSLTEDSELDAWGRSLPPATLERFGRKALPVIQKRCGKSGCHDEEAPESGYKVRAKAYGPAQRLALLYNLRSTTSYVDFDNVDASPILDHPPVTNAKGQRVYPFGADRYSVRDCTYFVEWLHTLSDETKLAASMKEYQSRVGAETSLRPGAASRYDVVDVTRSGGVSSSTTGAASGASASNERALDSSFASLFEEASDENLFGASASNQTSGAVDASAPIFQQGLVGDASDFLPDPLDDVNSTESTLQRVGMLPQKTYRDEYDPAIFNDRYHPNTKPSSQESTGGSSSLSSDLASEPNG